MIGDIIFFNRDLQESTLFCGLGFIFPLQYFLTLYWNEAKGIWYISCQ